MDLHLDDKVVIVSGGTNGLGAALTERLAAEGALVTTCGRDPERVEATRARLTDAGGDALVMTADMTDPAQITAMIEATVERWGRIDGVVNNAGTAAGHPFEEIDDEQWQADLDLKVMGAIRLIRGALPHIGPDGGSIVNVLSIAAKTPGARSMPSSASRATGLAITKALSKEYADRAIRVNAVLIGLIESGQWERRAQNTGVTLDEVYRTMAELVPMGRVGRGDEFADLVSYLLSDRSSYVTGSAINLDGGLAAAL